MGSSVDELLEESRAALEDEEPDRAEALARRAAEADPRSVEALYLLGRALQMQDELAAAGDALRAATRLDPEDPDIALDLAAVLFEDCRFPEAEAEARRALELDPDSPDAHVCLALCVERHGRQEEADRLFERAHRIDPAEFPLPTRLSREEFRAVVEEAIGRLPSEFQACLENVSISVEDLPDEALLRQQDPPLDPCLYGLFDGIPRTERSFFDVPGLPDRIHIFQRNLERDCRNRRELGEEIEITLRHEIGHALGYDDDELEERGYG